jgi:hypothetical protein
VPYEDPDDDELQPRPAKTSSAAKMGLLIFLAYRGGTLHAAHG